MRNGNYYVIYSFMMFIVINLDVATDLVASDDTLL